MFFRAGRPAVADRPADVSGLLGEIDRRTATPGRRRDSKLERQVLRLRHEAGVTLISQPADDPRYAEPASAVELGTSGLPEVSAAALTPEVLRAGILHSGCLLVRGLAARGEAAALAEAIERAYGERGAERRTRGSRAYYTQFEPHPRFESLEDDRPWVEGAGGLLAADSPRVMWDVFEAFDRRGMRDLIAGYLGEPGVMSVNKSTLRKALPSVTGAWHQDGSFLGAVRALNVWLSLSRCGDEAPGLDVVPRRLETFVPTGTEGTFLSSQVSETVVKEAAGDAGILRPVFEPGDALLFDDLFLHQTAADPAMPNPRYAVEAWFFGPAGFPEGYVPLAY